MIKSITQLVTRRCNSRCEPCNIWKSPLGYEMTPMEFKSLYSHKHFKEIEDLGISGGEPLLRKDLNEVINEIIENLPKLKMLFLNSNCTYPDRIFSFVEEFGWKIPYLYIVASLEGDKKTHKKIRGIDSYDSVIATTEGLTNKKNVNTLISTTLSENNCNQQSINHVRNVAKRTGAEFTFRPANTSEVAYRNRDYLLDLSPEQMNLTLKMISEKKDDPFMIQLYKHLSGQRTIMGERGNIQCQAGEIMAFIDADGKIRPCIYSDQIIGDRFNGLQKDFTFKETSSCPCCTECQVYPKLNYGRT